MQSKVIKNIPDILALNCGMENIRDLEFWKIQQMVRFFFNNNILSLLNIKYHVSN
jgi:hypothetical protein